MLKHAHCCIMHGHLHLYVLSNRLTMLPWRVSSVAARAFGTSTSHGQEEEDRSLSRPCAGWMLASSGRTLAPFLDLPHLQCLMACSMQKTGDGKANTLIAYDTKMIVEKPDLLFIKLHCFPSGLKLNTCYQ